MSRILRGAYALTAVALLSTTVQAEVDWVSDMPEPDPNVVATSWDAYGGTPCGDCSMGYCGEELGCGDCPGGCGPNGCGLGLGNAGLCKRSQFFVGGEYLNIRSNFSEATAFVESNLGTGTFTYHQYDFDYSSSYRTYLGMRLCNCGGEIRFTYTDIDTEGSFDSGPLDTQSGTVMFTSPFEVILNGDGDSLSGTASVSLEDYDLAFSKTIPLGTPMNNCDCGDTCCGSCQPYCPAWDIVWTGAIRATNYTSRLGYASNIVSTGAVPNRTAESVVQFDGIGIRTGLLGRRYIGKQGVASVYVKGDISLLLGDVDYYAVGTAFSRHEISTTQVIPVTELEAGGTVYLTNHISASAGYLLSAWHDLGHRAIYDLGATGVQLEGMDDANMMMLDGFFARVEAAY